MASSVITVMVILVLFIITTVQSEKEIEENPENSVPTANSEESSLCPKPLLGGRSYTMFYGTDVGNVERIIREGLGRCLDGSLGRGVYVSRGVLGAMESVAELQPSQLAVLVLSVRVGRLWRVNEQKQQMKKSWHSYGYDTAWAPGNCGVSQRITEEICVWDPHRLKVVGIALAPMADIDRLQTLVSLYM